MTSNAFDKYYAELSDAQKTAADWNDGAFLLLAGPGSGKTRVLTARVARLLRNTPDAKFRVLALTFTNQAASEMRERLEKIAPDFIERTFIGTFHSFCTELLRQHGSHVGVKPDFLILSNDDDRRRFLARAIAPVPGLKAAVRDYNEQDVGMIPLVDRLKVSLVAPEDANKYINDQELASVIGQVYTVYDKALGAQNVLDFNSILQKAYQLASKFPGVTRNVRIAYKYWSMDEFQDTNEMQYRIVKALAGAEFKNIYAVADDDQIIYQWNGASFARIEEFTKEFSPKFYQLPTNFRCPTEIVEVANRLIAHNKSRHQEKLQTISGKLQAAANIDDALELVHYASDDEEAEGIATAIQSTLAPGKTIAVLARNKYIIEPIKAELDCLGVAARIVQRRADFVSKEYGLAYNILRLCIRNRDEDVLTEVTEGIAELVNVAISAEDIKARAESTQSDFYVNLITEIKRLQGGESKKPSDFITMLTALNERKDSPKEFMQKAIKLISAAECLDKHSPDMLEDGRAWQDLVADIRRATGSKIPLDRFLQELDMRSKEPPLKPDEVALMTIHASKGTEFDTVYLAGVVEGTLPSWQSAQKGEESAEMEEERRNCFVAVTRTRECLVISYANQYNKRQRDPSRFLSEMGLIDS